LLIEQIEAELGPLHEVTDEERKHTTGRFRDGESSAITAVLDAADAFPSFFAALAARDHGKDDAIFESQPTRDDLARRDHLARLFGALDPVTQGVSDTVLGLGERVREVSAPTYAIARLAATMSPKLRAKLAPATKFYGAPAAKAQATRKSRKKATG
ncbi:MAG: hypothetical protein ABI193_21750, partial [Minicystis sp.]